MSELLLTDKLDRLSLDQLSKSSPSSLPSSLQTKRSRNQCHQRGGGGAKNKSSNLSHVPCKFFKQGTCTAGANCVFSHSQDPESSICKYFLKGNCKFGSRCALLHSPPLNDNRALRLPPEHLNWSTANRTRDDLDDNDDDDWVPALPSSLNDLLTPEELSRSQRHLARHSLSSSWRNAISWQPMLYHHQLNNSSSSSSSQDGAEDDLVVAASWPRAINIPGATNSQRQHHPRQSIHTSIISTSSNHNAPDDEDGIFVMEHQRQDDEDPIFGFPLEDNSLHARSEYRLFPITAPKPFPWS